MIAAEGQTVASWLRTIAGCTVGDERTLSLVVQRLTHLPTVAGWFADGTVSWAVVRSVVYATRRLTVTQLAWVDETLAADGVGRAGMSGGAAPAPARPSLLVLADIEALAGIGDTSPRVEHTAELLWRAARGPVRITNTALERMSCDADIRMIVTDGAVPLGVTTPTTNVGAPPPRGRPQRPRHTNTAHRAGAGAASGDPPTCPSNPDTTTIPAAP